MHGTLDRNVPPYNTSRDLLLLPKGQFRDSSLKTDVAFCPINVLRVPFVSSRLLKQSAQPHWIAAVMPSGDRRSRFAITAMVNKAKNRIKCE